MSGAQFMAGPWSILDDDGLKVTAADGQYEPWHVAHICGACGHEEDTSEANARLIAAAPELYQALDALLRSRGVFTPGSDNYLSPLDEQGIAALAKARGEQSS